MSPFKKEYEDKEDSDKVIRSNRRNYTRLSKRDVEQMGMNKEDISFWENSLKNRGESDQLDFYENK